MLNSRTAFAVIVGKLIVWNGQKALYAKRGGKKRSRKFDGRRDMRSWDDLSAMCKICSAKSTSCEYRVVGKNFPCLKIPAPSVARQSGLPMHSPISQFRKVLAQFYEFSAISFAQPYLMDRVVQVLFLKNSVQVQSSWDTWNCSSVQVPPSQCMNWVKVPFSSIRRKWARPWLIAHATHASKSKAGDTTD